MIKFFKQHSMKIIVGLTILFIALSILSVYFVKKYESFGYSQNIPRNYDRITVGEWMDASVSEPNEIETASDLPKATGTYTLQYNIFGDVSGMHM